MNRHGAEFWPQLASLDSPPAQPESLILNQPVILQRPPNRCAPLSRESRVRRRFEAPDSFDQFACKLRATPDRNRVRHAAAKRACGSRATVEAPAFRPGKYATPKRRALAPDEASARSDWSHSGASQNRQSPPTHTKVTTADSMPLTPAWTQRYLAG
jgi:hypothetical protein